MRKRIILIVVLCLTLLAGCTTTQANNKDDKNDKDNKSGKEMTRAVFVWDKVKESDLRLLQRYSINTLYINSTDFHNVDGFRCYLLAGDNRFTSDDVNSFMKQAVEAEATGVVIDCEDWDRLPEVLEGVKKHDIPLLVCIPFWLDDTYGESYVKRILNSCDGLVVMNYLKGYEGENIKFEIQLCRNLNREIVTAYELQPVGMYDLKEINTYNADGLQAVEENYKAMFSGTNTGIAFHSLEWMKKLENK